MFQSKKYRWLLIVHIFLCILIYGQSTYFENLNVTNFKGYYTPAVIDSLFVIIFIFLSIFLFREKIKVYKKVIVGFTVVLILLISCYEYFILTFGGFKDHTEKIYTINDRFILRKQFIDYGRPYPYVIEESKYGLFIKYISPSMQISADEELDSVKVISANKKVLKLKVYSKAGLSKPFFLLGYDWNGKVNRGYIKVSKNNKEGFIDKKLNIIIPLEYNALGDINETLECIGYKNGQKGIINIVNKTFTPTK